MSTTAPSGPMTPQRFISIWSKAELSERAASHEHFIHLCQMLGQPTPASHDATGAEYTFEKGVSVTDGASKGAKGAYGFADVWWKGKFAWEYKRKGKHKHLHDAYKQLSQYREALDNPPLLVVSDIARIEIHTNFTGTAKQVHTIKLAALDEPESLDKLRRVFNDPYSFRPDRTPEAITEEVADQFARLALALRERGHEPHDTAHFLMKCMFCLFAEDVELLPNRLFSRMLEQWHDNPEGLTERLSELFDKMASGGAYGFERIPWFNGGLFREGEPAFELMADEIDVLARAGTQDWSQVEPSIFGTLFERSLDPTKRAQIGAHYTSREDILLVVEPVVMAPLRRRWEQVQDEVGKQLERRRKVKTVETRRKADAAISDILNGFGQELAAVRILDPACGSGNFLYVAIQQLLGLEKEVVTYAARPEIGLGLLPHVRPTQLHGLEVNPYAAELAQIVIWIGYLQWMEGNGFNVPRDPILEPITSIEHRDAILKWVDESGSPIPVWQTGAQCIGAAPWPAADCVIGNPPFLGSKVFRQQGLPDAYIEAMYEHYVIPNASDLCCYWFERARAIIESDGSPRVGLLATQGIRGGANRKVLERIKQTGEIFMGWADRDWVLDGAHVHVSIVGFDAGLETERTLDGAPVQQINANLTADLDLSKARRLNENRAIAFMGVTPSGKFEVDVPTARSWLAEPNSSRCGNSDVLRPWINAKDISQRTTPHWIIDFGCDVDLRSASAYEKPFDHVEKHVAPKRKDYRTGKRGFWCFERPRPAMRAALTGGRRYISTPMVSKHCMFRWQQASTLAANLVIVIARSDDYFFGVLHSSIHELWARGMGTQLREAESGFRYTPTTCFETFPLPWPPGHEPASHPAWQGISDAARALHEQRERWVNPPEWIDPIGDQVDAEDDFAGVAAASGEEARRLIRESAIQARVAKDARLKKRTLTNLYNERPTWLKLAHEQLDRAVLAAYAATDPDGGWCEDWAEVWKEAGAGQPLPEGHELASRRAEVEQQVLANLLRLNQTR